MVSSGSAEGRADFVAPPARVWIALVVSMGVGPLLLYGLSSVSALVVRDLGITSVQYGSIATTTFLSAAVGSLLLGRYADRLVPGRALVLISVGSAVGIGIVAGAPGFAWLLVGALFCGVAQSMSNPVTNRYIASLPRAPRGALIGWKQSGVQMSQLIAGLTVPSLALVAGWRIAIASGLMIAVLGVISGALVPRSAPSEAVIGNGNTAPAPRVGGAVWVLTVYTFCVGLGLAAINTYLPLYTHDELGFSVFVAGLTAAVVGSVGLASRIWWGRRSDMGASPVTALMTLACGSLLGAALAAAAAWTHVSLVWLGAAVFGASALAANSVTMVALLHLVPQASIGAASGRLATGLYLGFASGPVTFGWVLDHASYAAAWSVPATAFILAGASVAIFRGSFDTAPASVEFSPSTPKKG